MSERASKSPHGGRLVLVLVLMSAGAGTAAAGAGTGAGAGAGASEFARDTTTAHERVLFRCCFCVCVSRLCVNEGISVSVCG